MDSTYAPRSPDLSSFFSSPSKTQQPYHATQQASSYAPRSPQIPSYDSPSSNPYNQNIYAHQNNSQSAFGWGSGGIGIGIGNDFEYNSSQYLPPIPSIPPTHSFSYAPTTSSYQPPRLQREQKRSQPSSDAPQLQQRRKSKSDPSSHRSTNIDQDPPRKPKMSSRGPRIKAESSSSNANPPTPRKDPNPNNIEIKTKFPVARIKRIMQADEEVGKVAQVTPVAVNKALELFMIALVSGAADKAREKGGKKVTAQHLKSVVLGSPDQFDFLSEIVERISEAQEGAGGEGRKRKEKIESESSDGEKKVKKTRGRKKKTEA